MVVHGDIVIEDPDGRNPVRITHGFAINGTPSWSPDGRLLVFSGQRSLNWDLYVIDSDGTGLQRLTTRPGDFQPGWSPDGTTIAFVRQGIYVMTADGSGVRRISHGPAHGSVIESGPAWSPDGRRILFVRGNRTTGHTDLYVMRSDGSHLRRLTHNRIDEFEPVWSPDGKDIAFQGSPGGVGAILYTLHADGMGLRRLTSGSVVACCPSWRAGPLSGSPPPTSSPSTGPFGLPTVTVTPDHGPVGTRVHLEGDGFTDPYWQEVGRTHGGGYGVFLIGSAPGGCELIAGGDFTIRIGADGHLTAEVTVSGTGNCFQMDRTAQVRPGRYAIGIGCHACEVAEFRITAA